MIITRSDHLDSNDINILKRHQFAGYDSGPEARERKGLHATKCFWYISDCMQSFSKNVIELISADISLSTSEDVNYERFHLEVDDCFPLIFSFEGDIADLDDMLLQILPKLHNVSRIEKGTDKNTFFMTEFHSRRKRDILVSRVPNSPNSFEISYKND